MGQGGATLTGSLRIQEVRDHDDRRVSQLPQNTLGLHLVRQVAFRHPFLLPFDLVPFRCDLPVDVGKQGRQHWRQELGTETDRAVIDQAP